MPRGTFKGKRAGRKLPLFENSDFDLPFLFLVPMMIPKVCERRANTGISCKMCSLQFSNTECFF